MAPARSFVPPRSTPITQPPRILSPPYSAMSVPPEPPPTYTKYRARPVLFARRGDVLERSRRGEKRPDGKPPKRRKPITVGRVLKWLGVALRAPVPVPPLPLLIS